MVHSMKLTAPSLVLMLAFVGACSREPATARPAAAKPAPAAQPGGQAPGAETGVRTVTGSVVETMNAAGYTYARVKTNEGDIWAATSEMPLVVGDRVSVPLQMAMTDFHSKTLKRDFPTIYFVTDIQVEGKSGAAVTPPAGAGMLPSHGSSPTSRPADTTVAPGSISPAPDGMTVAAIWAKRAELNGKTVTVRGKVVKYNPEILDRNWLHIQDGTGNPKDGSHDLTITTRDVTKVGDVITATGKVAVNKDFGAGYAYTVMLEGATIK